MKKLVNRPEEAVAEMVEGMLALHPQLARLKGYNVLLRRDAGMVRDAQVALISGGGSGHEPAHAGYIGQGALSAAVAGDIFTSPAVDSIFAAIRAVTGKPGALLIVKNYTGDRLNFGLAAEMARAQGIPVKITVVADDVALAGGGNRPELAGARGLAGVLLIHKIAGAAAAAGRSLDEVRSEAEAAAAALGTMGASLYPGTSLLTGRAGFALGEDEIELGLGIHGEPGARRSAVLTADQLADTLIDHIVSARGLQRGEHLAVLLNSLGITTAMEIAIVARRVFTTLNKRGMTIERFYSGALLTSLDMAGISLSLLPVDLPRLQRLDAPTSAPSWPNVPPERPLPPAERVVGSGEAETQLSASAAGLRLSGRRPEDNPAGRAILAACSALLAAEDQLTELDRITGDGDLGASLARGAKALREALPGFSLEDLPQTLQQIGDMLRSHLGGSSGPLYGVLFLRAGAVLQAHSAIGAAAWGEALDQACRAVGEMGGAEAGDRTMLDALLPFAQVLQAYAGPSSGTGALLHAAAAAATQGAVETAAMLPRRGRSSYLGERVLGHSDPGAVAASLWLNAVVASLSDS